MPSALRKSLAWPPWAPWKIGKPTESSVYQSSKTIIDLNGFGVPQFMGTGLATWSQPGRQSALALERLQQECSTTKVANASNKVSVPLKFTWLNYFLLWKGFASQAMCSCCCCCCSPYMSLCRHGGFQVVLITSLIEKMPAHFVSCIC